MKEFKYDAYIHETNDGSIKNKKWFQSGIINCDYIPEIFTHENVYTQLDIKGPIFMFTDCEIKIDFGPIKKGEKFKDVLLDYNTDCPHMDFVKNKKQTIHLDFTDIK